MKMLYTLPGKFQTDHLETRFGQYRQLRGDQYNISKWQVFAWEKIRILSVLKLSLPFDQQCIKIDYEFLFNVDTYYEGHNIKKIKRIFVWSSTNALLDNFCSRENDDITSNIIIILIMSCRQHGYPWPPLVTSPYYSSPLAGLQGYILCPHIAAECMFELVVLLLLGHMWGSIGIHHLWARPCFSSSVLRVWFV